MQLKSVRKSLSHNSARSNRIEHYRRRSQNYRPYRSNISISTSHSLKHLLQLLPILVVTLVINLLIVENIPLENGYGDQKSIIIKDPKILGYLKETNLLFCRSGLRKPIKKKGMWVLASGCSINMC